MWCAARAFMHNSIPFNWHGTQHTLRAGIVRDDRELFHQIIVMCIAHRVIVIVISVKQSTNCHPAPPRL